MGRNNNNFDQTRNEGDLHDYNQTTNEVSNKSVNELGKVVPKKDDKIIDIDLIRIVNGLKQLSLIEVANLRDKINSISMFAEKIIKSKGFIWIELNLKQLKILRVTMKQFILHRFLLISTINQV